jgi:RND family efflux transporter MFP subunit
MRPGPAALDRLVRLLAVSCALILSAGCIAKEDEVKTAPRPALTVTVVTPRTVDLPMEIEASGNVAAWQEASIGIEVGGLRLADVLVNVGDRVRKGQLLARISDETVLNDVSKQQAAVQEAEANWAQAVHNMNRARELEPSGSISRQDLIGYETHAATTAARLASSKATLAAQSFRLAQTRVVAPDDGTISSRTATVGAVLGNGSELFKLIRKDRLEWRAELRSEDLVRVKPGQAVRFVAPDGSVVAGKVRQVAPTIDVNTRSGIVYVDLPSSSRFKAGMFISAVLSQGTEKTLVLPQSAVIARDGFSYAMRVDDANIVRRTKLSLGKRQGDHVALLAGLKPGDRVVAAGAKFLKEGDLVQVVEALPVNDTARLP